MIGHPPFFRLAARVTRNVRRRFARQIKLVEREVYRRVQAEARQVVGVTWRGRGADAFAQELNDAFFPAVRQTMAAIAQLDQQLAAAAGIMAQADEQVEATAGQLTESFDQIYGP
jgi:uncharacterized protein YukE